MGLWEALNDATPDRDGRGLRVQSSMASAALMVRPAGILAGTACTIGAGESCRISHTSHPTMTARVPEHCTPRRIRS